MKIYYVFILMCELFCNLPRRQGNYFTQVVPKSQRGEKTYQVRILLNPILKVLGQQFGVRFNGSDMNSTGHT